MTVVVIQKLHHYSFSVPYIHNNSHRNVVGMWLKQKIVWFSVNLEIDSLTCQAVHVYTTALEGLHKLSIASHNYSSLLTEALS